MQELLCVILFLAVMGIVGRFEAEDEALYAPVAQEIRASAWQWAVVSE